MTKLFIIIFLIISIPMNILVGEPIKEKTEVMVKMSDGINLSTSIYMPKKEGRFPVILIRSPYNKEKMKQVGKFFATANYATVIQDVRGLGKSEGQFVPFAAETRDGLETLSWLTKQSWCNGRVGLWGVSYLAYNGYMLLPSQHSSIQAFVDISGFADLEKFLNPGGAFHMMAHLTWSMHQMAKDKMPPKKYISQFMNKIFRTIPLSSLFPDITDQFQDIGGTFGKIKTPILHITGWYDYIYPSTLQAYNEIRKSHQGKVFQKLIIGPWFHGQEFNLGTKAGDEDFGPKAQMGFDKIMKISKEWFDHWLKDQSNSTKKDPPVKVFVMGQNHWREFTQWPPKKTVYQKWFFSSQKGGNSSEGDGLLSQSLPKKGGHDSYTFDPNQPVPTKGGANFPFFPNNLGVKNQAELEKRKDILIYTSPILKKSQQIIGNIKVILYAATEGVDSDFTAKLVEVRKNGYVRNIEDGIIRARYRHSKTKAKMLRPGQIYRYEIDLGATALALASGSRIRVEISSSNFPKYDRNPNTGEEPFDAKHFKKTTQQVYFSKSHPSHILLPIFQDTKSNQ